MQVLTRILSSGSHRAELLIIIIIIVVVVAVVMVMVVVMVVVMVIYEAYVYDCILFVRFT